MLREIISAIVGASRLVRRRPAFFAIGTLTLGLALGFATTMFGLVDGARHPAVPFDDPDRTFSIHWYVVGDKVHPPASDEELYAAFAGVPAFDAVTHHKLKFPFMQVGDQVPKSAHAAVAMVPTEFFRVTGVRPRLGRTFAPDEASRGNSVIVSDDFWRTWFENRSAIAKEEISIGDQVYHVVGVMPKGMVHAGPYDVDLWTPLAAGDSGWWGRPTAHLRTGATRAAAEAQLASLAARLTETFHVEARPYRFELAPLRADKRGLGGPYIVLLVLASAILLIACSNITTLMLARAIARRRDLALRLALGAKTRTLVLEQLAESGVLTFGGCIAGLMFAFWGIGLLTHAVPEDMRWIMMLQPHWTPGLFALIVTAITATTLVTGLLPAWQVARIQPMEPLKESSGGTTSRGSSRVKFLVAAELALSLTLLIGATLFARSTLSLGEFKFGFDTSKVLSASGYYVYRDAITALHSDNAVSVLLPRVEAVEGIESATSLAIGHPQRAQIFSDVMAGVAPMLANDYMIVGPHFVRTLGLQLLKGRDFQAGDEVQGAVIIDERALPILFPGGTAIGHSIRLGGDDSGAPWLRVIGVAKAADMYLPKDGQAPRWPPIYASIVHKDQRQWQVIARVSGNAPAGAVRVSRALASFVPPNARLTVTTFATDFQQMMRVNNFTARLLAAIGLSSLALAAAGLFAILSYTVNQRMREFAVRVAIGAQRRHILQLALRDAVEMALAGTAFGAFGGLFLGQKFGGSLYGIQSTDVWSLIIAESILLAVALCAATVPALRAMRADPVEVLRAT